MIFSWESTVSNKDNAKNFIDNMMQHGSPSTPMLNDANENLIRNQ